MKFSESERLSMFHRLRAGIRGSQKNLIVGIDIGKEKHHAFFGLPTGKTLYRRLVFNNSHDGFQKFIDQIEALKVRHNLTEVVIGVEPTASYHKPLAHFLTDRKFFVVLAAGTAVRNNRELLDGRWDKNDTKDAANIADLISQGKFQFLEMPSQDIQSLRELLSLRKRMVKEQRSLKVRVRNCLLAKYFPEMDNQYGRADAENLAIVRWCMNPTEIANMSYTEFHRLVAVRKTGLAQEKRLRALQQAAGNTIGCPFTDAAGFEARILTEKIQQTKAQISEVESVIEKISIEIPGYGRLLTIPGFGPFVSSQVLARIGNPFRFRNRSQVLKLTGFDLNANRSGKTAGSRIPVISRRGNGELRYALYQAAFSASTHSRVFIPYFSNLLKGREAERGIVVKMRVKLAAKMMIIAWTLLKRDEDFNPDHIDPARLLTEGK